MKEGQPRVQYFARPLLLKVIIKCLKSRREIVGAVIKKS
jgi:hypothetical protein